MKDFVQISVNEKIYKVLKGLTIIQACEQIGIQIPRFCYHEQLSIAGNCRMCLIELDNSVKPVASCAITIDNNMKIFTNTILVKKAREGVMEFLLINHPLDCPICDQGGECDLQDQALLFGNDRGRFYEIKRAVSDLELGPFIKTVMTRCIHCTRCVRFLSELGGSLSLGIIGRGNKTEIGYYTFTALDSEVSGNIIDLCPVGALTSKPYAFSARPWELIKIETIDTLDSMGSNLSYCLYGDKLMRVLPITHLGINEEWLSDKTRFSYDGFSLQRLVLPLILIKNIYKEITWKTLFLKLIFNIEESYLLLLNNDLSFETIYTIKLLKTRFKYINILIKDSLLKRNIDFRVSYLFNSTYLKIKQADFCFIIGSNLKQEMPLLLMKLRKEKRIRNLDIYLCGIIENYYINQNTIGLNLISLLKFLEGKHFAAKSLKKSQNPLIILGIGLLNSINSNSIINLFLTFKNFNKTIFNSINLLELNIGLINMYEIGILNDLKKFNNFSILNFNVDNLIQKKLIQKKTFLGTHGDYFLNSYKIILPVKVNLETRNIFLNNEGRAQLTKIIQKGPLKSKMDWQIILGLFDKLYNQETIKKISFKSLREKYNKTYNLNLNNITYNNFFKIIRKKYKIFNIVILPYTLNIYNNNIILKNSRILLKAKTFFLKDIYK